MTISKRLAYTFFRHAALEKYPTRSVEHMLAWMIVIWGIALAIPGVNMQGPTFKYLVAIAPEWWWSMSGFLLGSLRLVALFLNGGWRRSPGLYRRYRLAYRERFEYGRDPCDRSCLQRTERRHR